MFDHLSEVKRPCGRHVKIANMNNNWTKGQALSRLLTEDGVPALKHQNRKWPDEQ